MRVFLFLGLWMIADTQAALAANLHLGFSRHPSPENVSDKILSRAPVVDILDENGNLDHSNTCVIALQLLGGPEGAILGTSTVTAVKGRANFRRQGLRVSTPVAYGGLRLMAFGRGPGCSTLVAYSDYFSVSTATEERAAKLSRAPVSAPLSAVWATQPVVKILDEKGHLAVNDNSTIVSIAKDDGSPTGVLTGTTQLQVENGVAAFTDLAIASEGLYPTGRYFIRVEAMQPGTIHLSDGFTLGIDP